MAIGTPTSRGTASRDYGSSTLVSNTWTPATDDLLLAWVVIKAGSTTPTGITGHDGGTSWVQIGTTQSYGNLSGSLWGAHVGASPSSGAITITLPGTSRAQANFASVSGVDVSGTVANSFDQTPDSGNGYGSSISRTLTGATNTTMGFWGDDGGQAITPEGTVVNQLAHPGTNTEAAVDYAASGDATPTASLAGSTGHVSFAVELKEAAASGSVLPILNNYYGG